MMNYSPLRYPGGKARLSPFIKLLIEKTEIQNPVYIEPYAGGAGVALSLLIDGVVDEIVINDYDKAVYAMWRAILEDRVIIENYYKKHVYPFKSLSITG